jgi:D-3-phosphoglycerate dehydrogenase
VIAGDDHFTGRVLEASPRLRVLSKWGIGTDSIDKDAAGRLGIPVTNTPGVFGDEVADIACGYILMLARGMHAVDAAVRRGDWPKHEGETLRGKTLGVVGLGSIGRSIAIRGQALGMMVVGSDPAEAACEAARAGGVEPLELDDLFRRSDYVALAAPMNATNQHLVDARRLALLPTGSKLVNVARGGLVDEQALVVALQSRQLAGAALDVFEVEPLPSESPLRTMPQVVLGAHNGSNTAEAVERTSKLAVDNLLTHLAQPRI